MASRAVQLAVLIAAIGFCTIEAVPGGAEGDPAALAAALKNTSATLQGGLKASEAQGTPISAKFEIEDSKLQLSVYTTKGDTVTEVIADPNPGAIKEAETIKEADDLKEATAQKGSDDKGEGAVAECRRGRGERQRRVPGGEHLSAAAERKSDGRGDLASGNDV
jgi:hypothetical protein